jgi:integrase
MQPARSSALRAEPAAPLRAVTGGEALLAEYRAWLAGRGRGCRSFRDGARVFLDRWPVPDSFAEEPLDIQLACDQHTRPFITFLLLTDRLRPGYHYLVHRKFASLIELASGSRLESDLAGFQQTASELGFSEHVRTRAAERVLCRLLIQTGRGIRELCVEDLRELAAAFRVEKCGFGRWALDSERMVPLDEETLQLVDRIVEERCACGPLPHPRTGRPADFLLTHHGKRVSTQALRDELARAASAAGLPHVTPHQLRHTYATALVNAGCSVQSLMELLGHVSAAMSLRYGKLFNSTVRTNYERALAQAKAQIGQPLGATAPLPLAEITGQSDWRKAPLIKARLAGGYLLRAHRRPGRLPVHQRLRALPELPHRRRISARARHPAPRRRAARQRRRAARLGRGGRAPPPPDRPPGEADRPSPGRERVSENPARQLKAVRAVCTGLVRAGERVTFPRSHSAPRSAAPLSTANASCAS